MVGVQPHEVPRAQAVDAGAGEARSHEVGGAEAYTREAAASRSCSATAVAASTRRRLQPGPRRSLPLGFAKEQAIHAAAEREGFEEAAAHRDAAGRRPRRANHVLRGARETLVLASYFGHVLGLNPCGTATSGKPLHQKVLREHHGQTDTLVLDEFGVQYGTARVDVAVINGRLHGFEIKSDRDTLGRLPEQVRIYGGVFDRVTLVVGEVHHSHACALIPEWWGIKVASLGARRAVHFRETRAPNTNPAIDPVAVAALLWCDELTEILVSRNAARGLRGKARDKLARAVAGLMSLDELRAAVRERLKSRSGWRARAPGTSGGDSSPPLATS